MTSTLLVDSAPARQVEHPDAVRDRQAAERIYPPAAKRFVDSNAPPAVQQIRKDDGPARQMYRDLDQFGKGGGSARDLAIAMNNTGTDEAIASTATVIAAMATDMGLTREDISQFAAYTEQLAHKPYTAEEKVAAQRTIVAELRREYGARFSDAWETGKALAALDPRFKTMLDKTGLGDHPAVVKRFTELGQTLRARTLLARKK